MELSQRRILPKMIVFDLDYTLWPLYIEMYDPPFSYNRQQKKATDIHGRSVTPYPEATEILEELKAAGILLGVASRTTEIKGARKLIEALGWDKYLTHKEIFPGCKITHFNNLTASSKIPLEDMLFFDDEMRNIRDLTSHGVVCKEVKDGVNRNEVKKGLINFENMRTSK